MEPVNADRRLELLRRANQHFSRFFERFSGVPVLGTDEEVQALVHIGRTLRSVAPLLGGRYPESADPEVLREIDRYRINLLQLRDELACMETSAAGCRARLNENQKHLHAAKAWCAASRCTT
jgi:hypothetical protein